MELAVFGHMRNEARPPRRHDAATACRVRGARRPVGGQGRLADGLSADRADERRQRRDTGHAGGHSPARPDRMWTLGIVRRMRRLTIDRAELGLQVIANTLVGVDLVEQRKHADNDYSVDGEQTTINGRTFQGLFLALRKREADVGVQSLIVPAAEFQPANRLKLMTAKSINPIRYGRLIEQQPDWVWATVEPLELHAVDVRHDRSAACRRQPAPASSREGTGAATAATKSRMAADHYAEAPRRAPLGRSGALQHRARVLRPLGRGSFALRAVLGGRVRRARRAHVLGPAARGEPVVQCACAPLGVRRGDKVALSCRSGARRPSRTSPSTRWARWPFRCRSCSAPMRSNTACSIQRGEGRAASTRSRCRTSTRCARSCRRLAHVIGVAGAQGDGITPWETLRRRSGARRFDAGRTRARTTRRSSSTPAAPRVRRKAR